MVEGAAVCEVAPGVAAGPFAAVPDRSMAVVVWPVSAVGVVSLSGSGETSAAMPVTPQHIRISAVAPMSAILPLDVLRRFGAWFQLVAAGGCAVEYGGIEVPLPACG